MKIASFSRINDENPAMNRHQNDPMDRPLDLAFVRHRARKRIAQVVLALAALIGGFLLLSAWITPSVARNDLRTAVVDSGLVEASISASGTVRPTFEEASSS